MVLASPRAAQLRVEGESFREQAALSAGDIAVFSKVLELRPGVQAVRLSSDAAPIEAAGDARRLVFQVVNFRLTEAP